MRERRPEEVSWWDVVLAIIALGLIFICPAVLIFGAIQWLPAWASIGCIVGCVVGYIIADKYAGFMEIKDDDDDNDEPTATT